MSKKNIPVPCPPSPDHQQRGLRVPEANPVPRPSPDTGKESDSSDTT